MQTFLKFTSTDAANKKVEMTLRSIEASQRKGSSASTTLSDLKEGQKVDGIIKRIEDYGLFVQIDNSKLSGLCHKSEVSLFYKLRFWMHLLIFNTSVYSYLIIKPPMSPQHFEDSGKEIV